MTRVGVKDFGPISQASVEMKPLTVFVGPNNSGKSYLALVIYCLSRMLSTEMHFGRRRTSLRRWGYGGQVSRELFQQARDEVKKAWPTTKSLPRKPIKIADLPSGLQDVLEKANQAFANDLSSEFGRELTRCYGTDIGSLVRRGSALNSTQLEVSLSRPENSFTWEMQATEGSMITKTWDSNLLEQVIEIGRGGMPLEMLIEDPEYFLVRSISELGLSNLTGSYAHYMPASRSGILLGHRTLAGLIVGQSSRAWLDPIEIPRLPGVITDLIQALLLLQGARPPGEDLLEIIEFLEEKVARGFVGMEAPADARTGYEYPEVYYESQNGKFLLHQVSSMVSEIAPIVLFLKHLVRKGHLFIIEEPESHIDAENQRKLARAIAMLVNSGVKVLITTHSDYFVNQINNLLLLSQVSSRRRAARNYSASEVLKPNDVGAYLFEPSIAGSEVRELKVSAEEGIPIPQFTEVHSSLYDEAVSLEHVRHL